MKLYQIDFYNNLDNLIYFRLKHFGCNFTINNFKNSLYIGFYKNYILLFSYEQEQLKLIYIGVNDLFANMEFYFTDVLGKIDRIYDFYNHIRMIITIDGNIYLDNTPLTNILVGKLSHSNLTCDITELLKANIDIINNNNYPNNPNKYSLIFK